MWLMFQKEEVLITIFVSSVYIYVLINPSWQVWAFPLWKGGLGLFSQINFGFRNLDAKDIEMLWRVLDGIWYWRIRWWVLFPKPLFPSPLLVSLRVWDDLWVWSSLQQEFSGDCRRRWPACVIFWMLIDAGTRYFVVVRVGFGIIFKVVGEFEISSLLACWVAVFQKLYTLVTGFRV